MFDIIIGMTNVTVLVALICIGIIIKQSPIFDKIANKNITFILAVCGIAFMFIYQGISFENAVVGMATSLVATGTYEHVRNLIPKKAIDKFFPKVEEE